MRLSISRFVVGAVALAGILAVASVNPAQAQDQFGDFSIFNGSPFIYDNPTGVFSASVSGIFIFQNVGTPPDYPTGFAQALFTVTANTPGVLVGTNLALNNLIFSVTDNSGGATNGQNILSIAAPTTGSLNFSATDVNTGSLRVDSGTDNFSFTSDVLIFSASPTATRTMILSLPSIDQTGNPDTSLGFAPGPGGRPVSFNSGGGAQFASTPLPTVVPEANAGLLAMMALPMIGGVMVARRRKN